MHASIDKTPLTHLQIDSGLHTSNWHFGSHRYPLDGKNSRHQV
jgi:hypothetical protein